MTRPERSEDLRATKPTDAQVALKDQALRYLKKHPDNFAGCGKELGIDREAILDLRNLFCDEFLAIENEYLDELEELCRLSAIGDLPPHRKDFNFAQSQKILERRRSATWIITKKTQIINEDTVKSNGIGEKKTDEYLRKFEKSGSAVRPGTLPQ